MTKRPAVRIREAKTVCNTILAIETGVRSKQDLNCVGTEMGTVERSRPTAQQLSC